MHLPKMPHQIIPPSKPLSRILAPTFGTEIQLLRNERTVVYRDVAVHVSILCEAFGTARVLARDGFGMRLLVTSGYCMYQLKIFISKAASWKTNLRSWGVQYDRWGWQVLQMYVFELVEEEGDGVSSS